MNKLLLFLLFISVSNAATVTAGTSIIAAIGVIFSLMIILIIRKRYFS